MKTQLSFADLAGIETELLAVLAADTQTSKEPDAKPEPVLLTADAAVMAARCPTSSPAWKSASCWR